MASCTASLNVNLPVRVGRAIACTGAVVGLVLISGCVSTGSRGSFVSVAQGDLEAAMEQVRPHLVHVTLKKTTPGRSQRVQNMILRTPAKTRIETYTGIVIAEDGHVLVPFKVEQDTMQDVKVWVGEEEQDASFVANDEDLGMSILRIPGQPHMPPLPLAPQPEVPLGHWLASVSTTGEGAYFAPRAGLFMVYSRRPTRYPELDIDGVGQPNAGAPLLNRAARPVAIVRSANTATVLSPTFCNDLADFITESLSDTQEEDEEEKGRLGICLDPINKDHARFLGVERSALWVSHVLPDSAADKAGIRTGDLIVAVNDEPLRDSGTRTRDDFNWRVRRQKFEPFTVTVWRDGATTVLKCTREPRPDIQEFESKELGLVVREIDEGVYAHRNLSVRHGVLVKSVRAGSPASTSSRFGQALIRRNDVIVELNGMPTPDIRSFTNAAEEIRKTRPGAVLVKYRRGRVDGYAGLNLTIGSTNNGASQ